MPLPPFLRWLSAAPTPLPATNTNEHTTSSASRIQEQINPTYAASSPTEEDWYWGRFATGDEEDYYWRRLSDNWYQKDVIPSIIFASTMFASVYICIQHVKRVFLRFLKIWRFILFLLQIGLIL